MKIKDAAHLKFLRLQDIHVFPKRMTKKVGMAPGTLVYTGEKAIEKAKVTVIDYTESAYEERDVEEIEDCFEFKDKPSVTWINLNGIHRIDFIEKIGNAFDIHPLVLEDILDIDQRPKIEDYGKYFFIILKMLSYDDESGEIKVEQISMILTSTCVITLQESEGDVFDGIRMRLRNAKGRLRKMGADYLAYSMIDAIIDEYFIVLERLGENVEKLESDLIMDATPETLARIHRMKREMLMLRRSVWPLREIIGNIERTESPLLRKGIEIYVRDLYDHTIQVIDTIESIRDMLSGMLDIYLSSMSNRMNEVMKVLTIIATIFIPLTFLAGVYGMNFMYMPELEWQWGYPIALLLMLVVGLIMLVFFRRKKWL